MAGRCQNCGIWLHFAKVPGIRPQWPDPELQKIFSAIQQFINSAIQGPGAPGSRVLWLNQATDRFSTQIAKLPDFGVLGNPNSYRKTHSSGDLQKRNSAIWQFGPQVLTFGCILPKYQDFGPSGRILNCRKYFLQFSNSAIQQFRVRGHPAPGYFGKIQPPTVFHPDCQIARFRSPWWSYFL